MTWLLAILAALLLLPVPGGAPGPLADPPPMAPAARWSESEDPAVAGWTDALGRSLAAPGLVLGSSEDQRAFVATAPPAVRAEVAAALAAVDPTTEVAVVGGFSRCTEETRVDDLALVVVEVEPRTDCAWSPWTVDLHVVPR